MKVTLPLYLSLLESCDSIKASNKNAIEEHGLFYGLKAASAMRRLPIFFILTAIFSAANLQGCDDCRELK
jgi:hypothetical protein